LGIELYFNTCKKKYPGGSRVSTLVGEEIEETLAPLAVLIFRVAKKGLVEHRENEVPAKWTEKCFQLNYSSFETCACTCDEARKDKLVTKSLTSLGRMIFALNQHRLAKQQTGTSQSDLT
jgi:hypothetical protein